MGIVERRAREKSERRRLILEAAARRLLRVGVENTTMTDIADEAELSKGALYLYFKSKEELIYTLLSSILHTFKDRIVEAAATAGLGLEKIRAMRAAYVAVFAEYSDYLYLFHYLDYRSHAVDRQDSGAWRCFRVIDDLKEQLVHTLQLGQADGSMRAGFDARKSAEMQVHMIESFLQRIASRDAFIKQRSTYQPEELVEQMFDMIEYYLGTPPAAEQGA
ncbi:MAG: TetR/AcrR family transcriptional regulator [Spirochaetaceae bacterium]|nr:MAG: TetR/AcrR family transcriptional regulator [Spirochaetaceae bacterium]